MKIKICKLKFVFNISLLAIILAFFVFLPIPSLAGSQLDNALQNLTKTANEGYGSGGYTTDLPSMIGQIVGALLAFLGIVFLALMIYGGFIWMTARGNEQLVAKAKDLITAAVIGLVIILGAYAITAYVGGAIISGR